MPRINVPIERQARKLALKTKEALDEYTKLINTMHTEAYEGREDRDRVESALLYLESATMYELSELCDEWSLLEYSGDVEQVKLTEEEKELKMTELDKEAKLGYKFRTLVRLYGEDTISDEWVSPMGKTGEEIKQLIREAADDAMYPFTPKGIEKMMTLRAAVELIEPGYLGKWLIEMGYYG